MSSSSKTLLRWFAKEGRHDLPWQKPKSAYRVWVSEIMLQQTQVATVIPYFQRFISAFPSVKALAEASLDEVLAHWSGLGYYARARHLHQTAKILYHTHHGRFPKTVAALCELPGIGRSTAGAILSLAMKIRAPILDGNVKRVLTRYHAIAGWPGDTLVAKAPWEIAETHTPLADCDQYNQALMDLGATLCTKSKPQCHRCPLATGCKAFTLGVPLRYPEKKSRGALPLKKTVMLILQNRQGHILLEKRPLTGIWGGLWSFPECDDIALVASICQDRFHCLPQSLTPQPVYFHQFTHFKLAIHPVAVKVKQMTRHIDSSQVIWYNENKNFPGGIAAPVAKLLKQMIE